jgi:pimeloyl-ACP methyl ester carboxylesterase
MSRWSIIFIVGMVMSGALGNQRPFFDRSHSSAVFGEDRNYRIFLPADYDTSNRHYPVIYYFHGHSDRYTLERYDNGHDTVPRIAAFVAENPVIVVSVDGYVARDYTGFYGGSPWDVRRGGGQFDFGVYFLELVNHIDGTYRTLTDRRNRATCGLSMGGFMSLYLSARYPDRVGSASAFNPGPEFYTGEPGRRILWRPKDHVSSHRQSRVRLVRASGDFISQYHEETRDAYSRDHKVDFEYRRDEYHRHAATSIEETFRFHMTAFAESWLDNVPEVWSYCSAYRNFQVWGLSVEVTGDEPAFTYLEEVRQGGMRIRTRRWAPDGPPADQSIGVTTAPLYRPNQEYTLTDLALADGRSVRFEVRSDDQGRLHFQVGGSGHQVSFSGPGTGAEPPVVLPGKEPLARVHAGKAVSFSIPVYNPRATAMDRVEGELTSEYPTVEILTPHFAVESLEPATIFRPELRARFTAGNGYLERARLHLKLIYDGWYETTTDYDVLVVPEDVPSPLKFEILDGRSATFNVFHQKGNQGGGSTIERSVTEGRGNGNGKLEPGEQATIWVQLKQGLDPFDKNNWYRCKVWSESPWITVAADIEEQKQLEWTGAQERTSLIEMSEEVPPETNIRLLLDNESWSFHYTPDVRYGAEPLYQAFQLHERHLHQLDLVVP